MTAQQPTSTHRKNLLQWLESLPADLSLQPQTLTAASSDASFRRYDRIQAGLRTLIVMDAPPTHEDCRPFIDVTHRLADVGLSVPQILASDLDQGFLLLSDLGHETYYDRIQTGISEDQLQKLYVSAIEALVTMQTANSQDLAPFNAQRVRDGLNIFVDWYVNLHYQTKLTDSETQALESIFELLANHITREPAVLVHRDFHSPNLMISQPDETGQPGIIDYQDATYGPISYDLASLVFDARTTWEEPRQLDWAIRYWEKARAKGLPIPHDFAEFHVQYEWTSLQRNVQILGVFARLNHRDGKSHYLNHVPRVLAYVRQVAQRYHQFTPLLRVLDRLEGIQPKTALTF